MSVTLPTDANVLPLGRYMLFVMVDDIPSVARIINVRAANSADLNGDGVVGPFDLVILLGAWGRCLDCANCPADLNADCIVGASDLAILLGNWG